VKDRRWHIVLIMVLSLADIFRPSAASAEIVVGDVPLKDNPNVVVGRPNSVSYTAIVISRRQYVIGWDYERRSPEWVAWTVNKRKLGEAGRSNSFRIDPDLDAALVEQNRESVSPDDYRNSCLDRGHQVPSGDRTASETDNETTFLMSNVMPQSAFLNRRTWVSLERFVRQRVLDHNERAAVYAGSILDEDTKTIGPKQDIHVPSANFKIIVLMPATREKPSRKEMKYFVVNFPNVTSKGTNPVDDREQACWDSEHTIKLGENNHQAIWRPYLTSLDEVQKSSGISFDFLQGIEQMTPDQVDGIIAEGQTARHQ